MEACYGGADVMERSCAVARGIDINKTASINIMLYEAQAPPEFSAGVRCIIYYKRRVLTHTRSAVQYK